MTRDTCEWPSVILAGFCLDPRRPMTWSLEIGRRSRGPRGWTPAGGPLARWTDAEQQELNFVKALHALFLYYF